MKDNYFPVNIVPKPLSVAEKMIEAIRDIDHRLQVIEEKQRS